MKPKAVADKFSETAKTAVVPEPVTAVQVEPKKAEPVASVDPGKFSPEGVGTV